MTGPRQMLDLAIERTDGRVTNTKILARVDTVIEMSYLRKGGILNYVMSGLTD